MEYNKNLKETIRKLYNNSNVQHPDDDELRQMAEEIGTFTEFGNLNFSSAVRNRSSAVTVYLGSAKVQQTKLNDRQKAIIKNAPETIKKVNEYIQKAPLVCVEQNLGDNQTFAPYCRMYVSVHRKDCIRLPYMWNNTLFKPERKNSKGPEMDLIYIPEWHEKDRQVLVIPEQGITYVLGTDYFGEAKKGFLRMGMWYAKQEGMLGLHAGAKILNARDKKGKLNRYSMLLFGLSATGKTTHACHNHGLTDEGEEVEIVQDDVVFWRKDGSVLGSEQGFFIKTDGLDAKTQPLLYNAAIKKNALFENVMVDYKGDVDFDDTTLTGNGRGIINMSDLAPYVGKGVNIPPLDELDGLILAFITRRNTVLPIVSKLTPEQAAIAFMLGESIETSAGDPMKAGKSIRVVGTNPFIIGDEGEEGNIFFDFVNNHDKKIECFLLNTGGVGEITEIGNNGMKTVRQKVTRVEIAEMAAIIREIARKNIEWVKDPYFNTMVPRSVDGVDMERFNLTRFYTQEQIDMYVNRLKDEREEYLKQFKTLRPEINLANCLS
ncbi:MAG: phosphoenolpyruvate carboxykinase domain-containing protein [Candidatus Anammoxibacter sp.]